MLRNRVLPYALALFAGSALLAGCATTEIGPIGTNAATQTRSAHALLYVAGGGTVGMYSYPALKFKGTLTGINYPVGLCIDSRTQDIWVVDASAQRQVVEYKHGATAPLRTIKIDAYYPILNACAVNPRNDDLAVTSEIFGSDEGALMILKRPYDKAKFYNGVMFYYDYVGYDANGDAFVDGYDTRFELAELAYGSKKLERIRSHGSGDLRPGGIQYDGSSLAVGNRRRLIYQISNGGLSGKTLLSNACRVGQFFIDGSQVIVPNRCEHEGSVSIYDYPAGGAPTARIDGLKNPFAVAISV